MRIGVDAHAVGRKLTGNETYIRNLLREYAQAGCQHDLICYVASREAERLLPRGVEARLVAQNPFLRLGLHFPAILRKERPDLLHVQYTSPLACPVPVVSTVHDVSYIEAPQYLPPARARQLRITAGRTIRRAARIITPSRFSRDRLIEAYKHERPDIGLIVDAIHNGVDPRFRPIPQETAVRRVRERYGISAPYILNVGDLQPRKNQTGLVRAFAEIVKNVPKHKHDLVLVGKENWHGREVRDEVRRLGIRDRVHFTGFVPDEEMLDLYAGCEVFVFPSLYEGFGLPVLEAMACGRPVACSNTTVMPEVADSAAFLFDPEDREDLVKAMLDFLNDGEQRVKYGRRGQARAAKFTWRDAAAKTWDVYERVVEEKKGAVPVAASHH